MLKSITEWLSDLASFTFQSLWRWGNAMSGGAFFLIGFMQFIVAGVAPSHRFVLCLGIAFLGLAAFGAWREERRNHQNAAQRVYAYENNPLEISIANLLPQKRVVVRVVNPSTIKEIRVQSVQLVISNRSGIEEEVSQNLNHQIPNGFPYLMPKESSFEISYGISIETLWDWEIVSLRAQVTLGTGAVLMGSKTRVENSPTSYESPNFSPKFIAGITLDEGFKRKWRIDQFVHSYEAGHNQRESWVQKYQHPKAKAWYENIQKQLLSHAMQAGLPMLENDSEAKEAFEMITHAKITHAFKPEDFDKDIVRFFKLAKQFNIPLHSADGEAAFEEWLKSFPDVESES